MYKYTEDGTESTVIIDCSPVDRISAVIKLLALYGYWFFRSSLA
jgi:hypothetical protein